MGIEDLLNGQSGSTSSTQSGTTRPRELTLTDTNYSAGRRAPDSSYTVTVPTGDTVSAWSAIAQWMQQNDVAKGWRRPNEEILKTLQYAFEQGFTLPDDWDVDSDVVSVDGNVVTFADGVTLDLSTIGIPTLVQGWWDATHPTGHAKGLWEVPYDDYAAYLHRGERVLTASQARAYDEGETGGVSAAIVGAIQELRNDMQNLRIVVGQKVFGQTVVDYSGKRMQGYMGKSESRQIAGYGWG